MRKPAPILARTLPGQVSELVGTVSRIWYPPQGETSSVAVIENKGGRFVVKRASGEQFCNWLEQEYRVTGALAETALPIPHPHLFIKQETAQGPESWLVMDYLDGEPLRTAVQQETDRAGRHIILRAFGSILATIHRTSAPQRLPGDHSDWLDHMLEQAEYNLHHYTVDGSAAQLAELRQHRPRPVPVTLIHGDFTVDNVLIKDRKVIGVIDWMGGGMGDPRYDLALAIRPKSSGLFHEPQDRAAFFEGYGELVTLHESEYSYFVTLYEFF